MFTERTRRWGAGMGLVAGATVAAVMVGAGAAHADVTADLQGVMAQLLGNLPDSAAITDTATATDNPLGLADMNLTEGVTLLGEQLSSDPTNNQISQHLSIQNGSLNQIDPLQTAETTILDHTGPFSSTINDLFFAPVNGQWASASENVLAGDHTYADALNTGDGVASASFALTESEFGLVGAQWDSLGIVLASLPFAFDSLPTDADFSPLGLL